MRHLVPLAMSLAFAVLPGCTRSAQGGEPPAASAVADPQPAPPPPAPPPAVVAPTASAPVAAGPRVDIDIASVANTMTFDKTKLTVPAGSEVHLTFKNNTTITTLPHNWMLVKPGTEASVAAAGLKLGEPAGYVDEHDADMLVHTPLAKPGATVEVTFPAPPPGDYPYICSVPGHYLLMKGVLTVTP